MTAEMASGSGVMLTYRTRAKWHRHYQRNGV